MRQKNILRTVPSRRGNLFLLLFALCSTCNVLPVSIDNVVLPAIIVVYVSEYSIKSFKFYICMVWMTDRQHTTKTYINLWSAFFCLLQRERTVYIIHGYVYD